MGEEKWGKIIVNNKALDVSGMTVTELENVKSNLEQQQVEIEKKINNILGL